MSPRTSLGAAACSCGSPPGRALDLARAADLVALAELAARAGQHPVATRAAERLCAIARTGDLHVDS